MAVVARGSFLLISCLCHGYLSVVARGLDLRGRFYSGT